MTHKCSFCGETDKTKFYGHKKHTCGPCHNQYTIKRGQEVKLYVLTQLGNCCSLCGYSKCMDALDIHHTDPTKKDKNFRSFKGWGKERIDREIEFCTLLCANCHREVHAGITPLQSIGKSG